MSINKPYKRNVRIFVDGKFSEGGRAGYIEHSDYASNPEQYIRSFLLIQKDLQEIFEYVEPSDSNLGCYSYRIHELLLRICIEVEANLKAIMLENKYTPRNPDYMNMKDDYFKVNKTHRLSSYKIKLPVWKGTQKIIKPFEAWEQNQVLPWYDAYNKSKHDRQNNFELATFKNLIAAISGLAALISSQFYTFNITPGPNHLLLEGPDYAIGGNFEVMFPDDWLDDQKYEFNWQELVKTQNPIEKIDYDNI